MTNPLTVSIYKCLDFKEVRQKTNQDCQSKSHLFSQGIILESWHSSPLWPNWLFVLLFSWWLLPPEGAWPRPLPLLRAALIASSVLFHQQRLECSSCGCVISCSEEKRVWDTTIFICASIVVFSHFVLISALYGLLPFSYVLLSLVFFPFCSDFCYLWAITVLWNNYVIPRLTWDIHPHAP